MNSPLKHFQAYLERRPDARRVTTNTAWLFGDRILRLVLTVIVSAWVARYLGTEVYGQLNIAQAYVVLALPLLKLGMDTLLVREIVHNIDARHTLLGTALAMRLLVSLAALLPVALIVRAAHPESPIIAVITLILMLASLVQSFEIIDFWFQSQVASKNTVIARDLTFLLTSALRVVAILMNAPLIVFGVLLALDTVTYMLALMLVYQRSGERLRAWRVDWTLARDLLKKTSPLLVSGIAIAIYQRIDQLMLAQLLGGAAGESAVGVYASAVRIAEAWYFVPMSIIASVFPVVLQSKAQSETLYRARVQRLFNLVVLISYAVAIPVTLLSGVIIDVLYGADFAAAGPILAVLVWSGVWGSLGSARTPVLHAENRLRLSMTSTIAGAVVNIALNVLLIPPLQGLGAAIATLAAQITAAHITTLFDSKVYTYGRMQMRALVFPNPFAA